MLHTCTTEHCLVKKNEITLLTGKCIELDGIISGTGRLTEINIKYFLLCGS